MLAKTTNDSEISQESSRWLVHALPTHSAVATRSHTSSYVYKQHPVRDTKHHTINLLQIDDVVKDERKQLPSSLAVSEWA